jgi:hypothetical protein
MTNPKDNEEIRLSIITNMCYSARPDFEYLPRPTGETKHERRKFDPQMKTTSLWCSMAKIFDNDILPYMNFKDEN